MMPISSGRQAAGPRGRRFAWALVPAVLAMAACSSSAPPPCPEARALEDARRMVAFREGGRDLTDKRFEVRIADVALACEVDRDEEKQTVRAEMKVRFDAEKGPANIRDSAEFGYFVAIVDGQQNVLRRKAFELDIPLPGNTTRRQTVETISPTLPLDASASPRAYRVLVGLALSRRQLRYNRQNPL